jgi:hypothetical protein
MTQDPSGNVDPIYQGTVTFSTTDSDPGAVLPTDYTITTGGGGDNGVHAFQQQRCLAHDHHGAVTDVADARRPVPVPGGRAPESRNYRRGPLGVKRAGNLSGRKPDLLIRMADVRHRLTEDPESTGRAQGDVAGLTIKDQLEVRPAQTAQAKQR